MPRGQFLFVRPIESADFPEILRLSAEVRLMAGTMGLVGKLVGETVSFALFEVTVPGTLQIEQLFVVPELRRKRIGRVMMAELEKLARGMECPILLVSPRCQATEFFLRLGFAKDQTVLRKVIKT